jgi:Tfp pilus assembly protein PilN
MSTVNLVPGDYLQRRSQRRANGISFVLLAVVMASVGGAALVSERSSRHTRGVCERINAQYAEAAKLIDEMHQLEAQKRRMLQKAEVSAGLMERLPRSYILAMIAEALPQGASVTTVSIRTRGVRLTPPDKPRSKHAALKKQRSARPPAVRSTAASLTILGTAATDVQVARLIANLARNPLTQVVDLVYSQETKTRADGKVRRYKLTVRLKPNADALDAIQRAEERGPADAAVAATKPAGGKA